MTKTDAEQSFTRFVVPAVLILIGLVSVQLQPSVRGLTVEQVTTIGFGVFSVGAFSFVIILNHARNPLATESVVVNAAQALVVYAGILTVLVYEQVFGITTMLIAVCVVLVIGTVIAVAGNSADLEEISN